MSGEALRRIDEIIVEKNCTDGKAAELYVEELQARCRRLKHVIQGLKKEAERVL